MFLLAPVHASDTVSRPVGVVELFTSQGCNACPPADRLLRTLTERGDVVTLAYHVDYWDYLGWKDTLARPENTARQKEYASALEIGSVYTPQAVIDGRVHVNGADGAKVEAAMAGREKPAAMQVQVGLQRNDDSLVIEIPASAAPPRDAHILIVYFADHVSVEIARGKNMGQVFDYRHVVTGFHSAGRWQGEAARFEMPLHEMYKKGASGVAVLVQTTTDDGMPGEILGASLLRHDRD